MKDASKESRWKSMGWEDCIRRDMRRSGEDERWRGLPIENYGNKEQKEWLDNSVTVNDPHACTAGNKEEEHQNISLCHSTNNIQYQNRSLSLSFMSFMSFMSYFRKYI